MNNEIKQSDSLQERISIMTELLKVILNCNERVDNNIISNTQTYKRLVERDYSTLYDSSQANLASIGEELRRNNNLLGGLITDENIRAAMKKIRA